MFEFLLFKKSMWNDFGKEVLLIVISALVSVLLTFLITKINFKKMFFSSKMSEKGIVSVGETKLTDYEFYKILRNSNEIRICYVSGKGFFERHHEKIIKAAKKGKKIKIILSGKSKEFLNDIVLTEGRLHSIEDEIGMVINYFKGVSNIEIKFSNTEYRLPFIISLSKDKKTEDYIDIKLWLYITLPPATSSESVILKGNKKMNRNKELSDNNLVDMTMAHFDAIWDRY